MVPTIRHIRSSRSCVPRIVAIVLAAAMWLFPFRSPSRQSAGRYDGFVVVRTLDLTQWAGRWVAVDADGRVRRDADSLADLMAVLTADGVEDLEVMRAPSPGDPVVYGLG